MIKTSAGRIVRAYMEGKGIVGACVAERLTVSAGSDGEAGAPFIRYRMDQRREPGNLLSGAGSVIVIGMGCYRERKYTLDGEVRGRFSMGAVGLDYHIAVRAIMDGIESALRENGYVFECYKSVDTGPLPEKVLAVKAGLGWMGKNGLVVNDELGSFFNIGYMLTTIPLGEFAELVPYRVLERFSRCGACDQCVKACPGNALTVNGRDVLFDYTKCVSYLTQKKGALTDWERGVMGLNLYGCDACQEACDYNRNAYVGKITDIDAVAPRIDRLLALTRDEFSALYKSTAIYWRGLGVLKRNALTAARNHGTLMSRINI